MTLPPVPLEPVFGKTKDRYLRWISRRHAGRYRMSKLGHAQVITLSHLVVSNDQRLAYVKNSKVACTSVSAALYQYSYGKVFCGNIHRTDELRQGPRCLEHNVHAAYNGAIVFSFVRNPVARARSAFINFFIDQRNNEAAKHLEAINARGMLLKGDVQYKFDIFLEYVEESMATDPERTDRHWRSQTLNTGLNMLPLSHVGRLENGLSAGLKIVSDLLGGARLEAPERPMNASSEIDFEPSRAQIAKIQQIYAEDYENFGY